MGLLYPFPVSEEEKDHVQLGQTELKLKSYGLPYIFWFYLVGILLIIFALALAVKSPIEQILVADDKINHYLAMALIGLLITVPTVLISAFFYEKSIIKSKERLEIIHKFFFLPLRKKAYALDNMSKFIIKHHLDSPNVAKLQEAQDLKGFENRGYYQIFLSQGDQLVFVDRHSQLNQMKRLQSLLNKY